MLFFRIVILVFKLTTTTKIRQNRRFFILRLKLKMLAYCPQRVREKRISLKTKYFTVLNGIYDYTRVCV